MKDLIHKEKIIRVDAGGARQVEDILLFEDSWQVYCDDKLLGTYNCLPLNMEQLAMGQLRYHGIIHSAAEVQSITVDEDKKQVRAILNEDTQRLSPTARKQATAFFSPERIHSLQHEFDSKCGLFRSTGSAHCCAVADEGGVLYYFEDVARHNAMDKLVGEYLARGTQPDGKALLFSGRLALNMVEKAVTTGVVVLISPGAPTLAAVRLARAHGLTLLGFVRPGNINIYCGEERLRLYS